MKSLNLLSVGGFFFILACASVHAGVNKNYPADWWKTIPQDQAASWEILPQEAGVGEVILSKRTELGIFSNFAATPITYKGKTYASLEGFWQATKFPEDAKDARAKDKRTKWTFTRAQVEQMTAFDAKHAGDEGSKNMKAMGIDWVSFDGKQMTYKEMAKGDFYKLIEEVTWEKVKQNADVKKLLLATGDLVLKPDHKEAPPIPPAWKYYDIYMDIRTQLTKP